MALVSPIKLSDEKTGHFATTGWIPAVALLGGETLLSRLRRNDHWAGNPSDRRQGAAAHHCPTEHCNAMPMEWVRPTDEALIKIAMATPSAVGCA